MKPTKTNITLDIENSDRECLITGYTDGGWADQYVVEIDERGEDKRDVTALLTPAQVKLVEDALVEAAFEDENRAYEDAMEDKADAVREAAWERE